MSTKQHSQMRCTNCGDIGHATKQCQQPITSFGVILFRIKGGWNQVAGLLQSDTNINGLDSTMQSKIEYLLIQRKDSLGFIDIMLGKYRLHDIEYISQQVHGMTTDEQNRILTHSFDALWEQLWGTPIDGSNSYRHEREQSKQKFEALKAGSPSLADIIHTVGYSWPLPEWGFPKGRRDAHETEYTCALRELWEETGVAERDIIPIKNLEPIREVFFGSNHIQYCHKYYIMYVPEEKEITLNMESAIMRREIGDIRWCSLEDGLALIRSDNVEKREVLLRVSRLLRNYCPLQTGPKLYPRTG
jgi:8-oxo-dGTP pyrophosphatase MutT (NUDIX family)